MDIPELAPGESIMAYGDSYLVTSPDAPPDVFSKPGGRWTRFKLCLEERAAVAAVLAEGLPCRIYGGHYVIVDTRTFVDVNTGERVQVRPDHPSFLGPLLTGEIVGRG